MRVGRRSTHLIASVPFFGSVFRWVLGVVTHREAAMLRGELERLLQQALKRMRVAIG